MNIPSSSPSGDCSSSSVLRVEEAVAPKRYAHQKTPPPATAPRNTRDNNILPHMPVQFLSANALSHKTLSSVQGTSKLPMKMTPVTISSDVGHVPQEKQEQQPLQQRYKLTPSPPLLQSPQTPQPQPQPQPIPQKKTTLSFKDRQRVEEEKRHAIRKGHDTRPASCNYTPSGSPSKLRCPRGITKVTADISSQIGAFQAKDNVWLPRSPSAKPPPNTMRLSFKDRQRYGASCFPPHHVGPLWLKGTLSTSPLQITDGKPQDVGLDPDSAVPEYVSSPFSNTWPPSCTTSSMSSSLLAREISSLRRDDSSYSHDQCQQHQQEKPRMLHQRTRDLAKAERQEASSNTGGASKLVSSGVRENRTNNVDQSTSNTNRTTLHTMGKIPIPDKDKNKGHDTKSKGKRTGTTLQHGAKVPLKIETTTTTTSSIPVRRGDEALPPGDFPLLSDSSSHRSSPVNSPLAVNAKDLPTKGYYTDISRVRCVEDATQSNTTLSPRREKSDVPPPERYTVRVSPPELLNTTPAFSHDDTAISSMLQDSNDTPRSIPPQHSAVLMSTTTSTHAGLYGNNERRERDKMLKRPTTAGSVLSGTSTTTALFSPTPPLVEVSRTNTLVDRFTQLVHHPEGGQFPPMLVPPAPHLDVSLPRPPLQDTYSTFSAIRKNRRTSTFSSLYFSMMKRQSPRYYHTFTSNPSQAIPDEETNHEVCGDSGPDEILENDCNDSIEGSLDRIGLLETEEHVFLPRYELLQDGRTAFESSLLRIRQSTRSTRETIKRYKGRKGEVCMRRVLPGYHVRPTKHRKKKNRQNTERTGGNDDDINNEDSVENDAFVFGTVSPMYTRDPEDEDSQVDCKIAARLIFDADNGVAIIAGNEEVGKYINQPAQDGNNDMSVVSQRGSEGREYSRCTCSMEFITRHLHKFDYTKHHAHKLYHHCVYCNRRPAAFLCLHCLKSTCPSHVTRHYKECEEHCTLFLNQLDIMTSFDRIFWCEKCYCFTWKYTEVYDTLVDHLAYTRGTYLDEAVRDISCVGYDILLKKPQHPTQFSTMQFSPGQEQERFGITADPSMIASLSPSLIAFPILLPLDSGLERVAGLPSSSNIYTNAYNNKNNNNNNTTNTTSNNQVKNATVVEQNSHTGGCTASPWRRPLQRDVAGLLSDNGVLCVGEAVLRLVSIGAKVQGWRSTQEDAEAAFVIQIPAFTSTSETTADAVKGDAPPETIRMAVFCVFDGHGGDAVAKLAASQFESHLHKAVASRRRDDEQARSLLLQLEMESFSQVFSAGEQSPTRAPDSIFYRHHNHNEGIPNVCETNLGDALLTAEAIRQHIVNTAPTSSTSPSFTPESTPVDDVGEPHAAGDGAVDARVGCFGSPLVTAPAAGLGVCTTGSPIVSREEMEMLRAYFAGIMEDAFLSLDDALRQSAEGLRGDYHSTGCTACVVGITANFILCANVGDSGAAVYTPYGIRRISVTHRVADTVESARIHAAGYRLRSGRIEGRLSVSRALGDYDFKQCGGRGAREQAVVALPDVTITPVPTAGEAARWGVIVACDGVWDSATLHQVHHAIVNAQNDIDVAGSAMDVVVRAQEMVGALRERQRGTATTREEREGGGEAISVDALLLASAAGIFSQCVAPSDNEEGIGMDNCSVILIERRA